MRYRQLAIVVLILIFAPLTRAQSPLSDFVQLRFRVRGSIWLVDRTHEQLKLEAEAKLDRSGIISLAADYAK